MQIAPAPLREARHTNLRALLREANLDALLVTSLPNVAYLTGLFASAGGVVITTDRVLLITDGRYEGTAKTLVSGLPGVELVIAPPAKPFERASLKRCAVTTTAAPASRLRI